MSSTRLFKLFAAIVLATTGFLTYADEPSPQWGLVRLSVAPMRSKPSHASEQVSQALMGTPVRVIDDDGSWSLVETPDGYQGYIINHSLSLRTDSAMAEWRKAPRAIITAPDEIRAVDPSGRPATDLVAGCIVEVGPDATFILPDGRAIRRLPQGSAAPLEQIASMDFKPSMLPVFASHYDGVPYLWGGLSSKGMDCSGLVRMAYMAQGRILSRDARDQALEGNEISLDELLPGDLLYFGNATTGRITHVAIYEGNGSYVHSSQLVRHNSLRRDSPDYLPLTLLHCRRIPGTPLSALPAYF